VAAATLVSLHGPPARRSRREHLRHPHPAESWYEFAQVRQGPHGARLPLPRSLGARSWPPEHESAEADAHRAI